MKRESAIRKLPKAKDLAHRSIRRLATIAFQHGKEDNDVWDPIDKCTSRNVPDIFNEMKDLSTIGKRTYECILAVTGPQPEIQSILRMVGFSLHARPTLSQDFLDTFNKQSDHISFIGTSIEATSIRDAVTACRKRISIATGLTSLYKNSHPLHVHRTALVRVNGNHAVFSGSEQAFRRLHPRSRHKVDVQEGLEYLRNESADKRLLGAIELLSLATSNSDPRVRLTNLWSSIETLTGSHEGKTTLERVLALIVPLVISRHVGRSTRYLAIETQKFATAIGDHNYGAGFSLSNKNFVSPIDMLKALSSPKGDPAICELLRFSQHPFLRFRIFCAWKIFHDPRSVSAMLKKSKTRLEWHVARIYRARNMLIHTGEEPLFLIPLLDNLQNYLAMAIQRLVHELKAHPTWNVRHAIEWWNGRMNHTLNSLEKHPHTLTVNSLIDGDMTERVWNCR